MEEILTKNIRKKNWKMAAEWGTKERSRSGGREPDDMKPLAAACDNDSTFLAFSAANETGGFI